MTVQIAGRFNGPPASGNGGYSCGVLAAHIDGPARIRLHSPPPLDRDLQVVIAQEGRVELRDGDKLVGTARPSDEHFDIPAPPTLEAAQAASTRSFATDDNPLSTCFVCGPNRTVHDGLELFPGPVDDWTQLACVWNVAEDLLDSEGNVRPEIVWAALDCPGFFAAFGEDVTMALLGELYAELLKPVPGGEPLIVYAWPEGGARRKRYAGAAIATAQGEVLAHSRSTWIVVKSPEASLT